MRRLPPKDWSYNGRHVHVPHWAEVPEWYSRNQTHHRIVQHVINTAPRRRFRKDGKRFALTTRLPLPISRTVVGVQGTDQVHWAVHRSFPGNPQVLSPFVVISDDEWDVPVDHNQPKPSERELARLSDEQLETLSGALSTYLFTVVMDGSPNRPRLLKAHSGPPMPPVPGQRFVTRDSVPFWDLNAFAYAAGDEGSDWFAAPGWFTGVWEPDNEPAA